MDAEGSPTVDTEVDGVADSAESSSSVEDVRRSGFIAVHVGAGYHSPTNSELYKQICRQACMQAVSLLREKKSALEAAKVALIALEDSPWTNAGVGSNLTVSGTVECDASIMDGQTLQYGAVGALQGVKNPILVAESLLKTQLNGPLSMGRIPPGTLVGEGAREWAARNNIETIKYDAMITDSSMKAFIKNKRKLDMLEEGLHYSPRKRHKADAAKVNGSTDGCSDFLSSIDSKKVIKMTTSNKLGLSSVGQFRKSNESEQNLTKVNTINMFRTIDQTLEHVSKNLTSESTVQENKNNKSFSDSKTKKVSALEDALMLGATTNVDEHNSGSGSDSETARVSDPVQLPCSDALSDKSMGVHKSKVQPENEALSCSRHCNETQSSDDEASEEERENENANNLLDTVGVVCIDTEGNIVSGVSSGGIILKQPGRLGQAALYGCGCWAENDSNTGISVGISTSGCGEHLTKTLLARECAYRLGDPSMDNTVKALADVFQTKFLESPFLKRIKQKRLGGALAIRLDESQPDSKLVEVLWAYTTDSMCLAYMSTDDTNPKALVSRLPEDTKGGNSCVVESKVYRV